jgi:hypothetical protein
MTTRISEREQSEAKELREITFKCKFCEQNKPLDEMRTLTRFFPWAVACQDCAKKMQ